MTRYDFKVEMTCEGCSKALDKILSRQKEKGEVTDYNVDLSSKNVSVTTAKELAEVVAILEKSGKKVEHLQTHAN